MSPRVTVVMPTYNSARFVRESIASVLEQSCGDLELIVVDDGSSDNTVDLIRSSCDGDRRVTVLSTSENSGAAAARNIGIRSASGRYIAFLDSDDVWLPRKLEKQLEFTTRTGAAVTFTSYRKIDADGNIVSEPITARKRVEYRTLLKSNFIGCSTALYDTRVCGTVLMPSIRKRQDYALWLEILRAGHEARGMGDVLVHYRVHSGSVSSNKLSAARYHWRVLRDFENLAIPVAMYYFAQYVAISSTKFLK